MKLYSYNQGSRSAKDLAASLGIKRLKHTGSRFRGGTHKRVINWGSTQLPPEVAKCDVLNQPHLVRYVTDKANFFRMASKYARMPEFTTEREDAVRMLRRGPVVARTVLNGSGGRGIVMVHDKDEMVAAPLYTQYVKKMSEFRLHVFRGEIIDTQRKGRKRDVPNDQVDWAVRNLAGGFIYVRHDLSVPKDVETQALAAFNWTGLDFGAVDVIWNQHERQAYVLEINTAPGLQGTTLTNYINTFKELV